MNYCKQCGRKTIRPKFCCNKHKDRFHNEHNPRGIFAHLKHNDSLEREDIEDSIHPLDPTALGQD